MGQANNSNYTLQQKLDFLNKFNLISDGLSDAADERMDASTEYEITNRFDLEVAKIGPDATEAVMETLHTHIAEGSPSDEAKKLVGETPTANVDEGATLATRPSEDASPVPTNVKPVQADATAEVSHEDADRGRN